MNGLTLGTVDGISLSYNSSDIGPAPAVTKTGRQRIGTQPWWNHACLQALRRRVHLPAGLVSPTLTDPNHTATRYSK
jgi:hypothetical protein